MEGSHCTFFIYSQQQDVPEVLSYILDNFCGMSVLAQDQIKIVIRNKITCTNCLQSDDQEDIHMIVKLKGNSGKKFFFEKLHSSYRALKCQKNPFCFILITFFVQKLLKF